MKLLRKILLVILLVIPSAKASEQQVLDSTKVFRFYFANNSSMLMLDYRGNQGEFVKFDEFFRDKSLFSRIDSIHVSAGSSMYGSLDNNRRLSVERVNSIKNYVNWKYPHIPQDMFKLNDVVINWAVLRKRLERSPGEPYRNEILEILSQHSDDHTIVTKLRALHGGKVAQYIQFNHDKYLRQATSVIFYFRDRLIIDSLVAPVETEPLSSTFIDVQMPENVIEEGSDARFKPKSDSIPEAPFFTPKVAEITKYTPSKEFVYTDKPLFAIKTNLLYDALAALNIAVEIPIGKHWSIAGEWIFPWWSDHQRHYHYQLLNANVEAKYWFSPIKKTKGRFDVMTGWFLGAYGGAGIYDFEYKASGIQGESFVSFGLMGGYAHSIGKDLRMEYSVGVGYMNTLFRSYETLFLDDQQWHRIRMETSSFSWIGPTHLKVSLVWLLNHKRKIVR